MDSTSFRIPTTQISVPLDPVLSQLLISIPIIFTVLLIALVLYFTAKVFQEQVNI